MVLALLAVLGALAWQRPWREREARRPGPDPAPANPASRLTPLVPAPDREVFASHAGSESCKECHPEAFRHWSDSHHGLAERPVKASLDRAAFEPARGIRHGTQNSEARVRDGRFELVTMGPDGRPAAFQPDRVLGVRPLQQFLFPAPGGRWQAGELAYDPRSNDWFNVYGTEDRVAGEWGHWTGRGMNWNSMCASCHNTRLRKHYDAATDTYATTMAERGVGCEACHGPMKPHVAWQQARGGKATNDPTVRRLARDQILDTCGSCHARRGELTDEFVPGQAFLDHYALTIPDETDLYYPDGQVREEDYEFGSFLGSRMHTAGVRCIDCHEPHSGKTRVAGDALCMRCHTTPVPPAPAPRIDPLTHSHHAPGTPGSACVDCHMPLTTYMQRHPRRDHGFTIPDPLLTQQHGVPNACNRCHADRTVDWAMEAANRWYGPRLDRPTRERAQRVAEARAGHSNAPVHLMRLLGTERTPLWRASAARLLQSWNSDPVVGRALVTAATADPDPLVRANAAHALEGLARPDNRPVQAALGRLLEDPVRSVRVAAAWTARAQLDTNQVAGQDLMRSLRQNLDQPGGLHQLGLWHVDRNQLEPALGLFQKAIGWDSNSPPFRHTHAIALNMAGRTAEAVVELQAACRLAPRDATYRYQLGLALNEAGRLPEATAALEEAVKLEPRFAVAHYNLGLAYAAAQDVGRALESLTQAEALQPADPRAPYARATILMRLGRPTEAGAAARRTLELQPNHAEAAQLLRTLEREGAR